MEVKGIIDIDIEQIYSHPRNPRKNLGELEELADSIKKNGVMQNLTVIRGHWDEKHKWFEDGYTLIIGHRRCAAAKAADVQKMPCRIVEGMDEKEQMSTMLEENMQRNDLTVYEQAQGFQMMMDLGESEESIAEKTGFSKTTIRRRLNIAKLDQTELQKKEKDESFQMTLKDLYELEKIFDIKTRDKILKESRNSRDLVSRTQNAVEEEKREDCKKIISGMLNKLGVEKAQNEVENEMWSGKWKTVKEFELDEEAPKQLKLPNEKGQMYWIAYYRTLKVIIEAPKEKRELSSCEQEKQIKDKAKKQIREIQKESSARRKEFIRNIISGKIDAVKDEAKEIDTIWQAMVLLNAYTYRSTIRRFFLKKDVYSCTDEEKLEAQKKAENLGTLHQMLIILDVAMENINETFDYNLKFDPAKGNALTKGYEALEPYGWYFVSETEKSVIDGTNELYKKDEEKNE